MKKVLFILLIISISLTTFFGIRYSKTKNELANTDTAVLIETIENLTNDNLEKELYIEELNQHIKGLNEQIIEYKESIKILKDDVNSKEIQISRKITELTILQSEYQKLLLTINELNSVVITFMYKDLIYEVKTIKKGESVTVNNPESTIISQFQGWSLNGVDIVDLSTMTFTENTTFFAIIDENTSKYSVYNYNYQDFPNSKTAKFGVNDEPQKCNIYLYLDAQFFLENDLSPLFDTQEQGLSIYFNDLAGNVISINPLPSCTYGLEFTTPIENPYNPGSMLVGHEYLDHVLNSPTSGLINGQYYEVYAVFNRDGKDFYTSMQRIRYDEESVIVVDFTSYGYIETLIIS